MAQHGINKVIIIGNLGSDPESRHSQSGICFTNCSVATSESWNDKQSGEKKEQTEWHRVVFIDRGNYKLGEYAAELTKGEKVFVEGRLRTRKWQDDAGADRYTTEIVAESFQRLSPKGEGQGQGQTAQQPQRAAQDVSGQFEDDIPF